jgi:hypothetical protein
LKATIGVRSPPSHGQLHRPSAWSARRRSSCRGIPAPIGQKEGYLLSLRAKTRRSRRCPDAIAQLFRAEPAKALVLTSIGQDVADGYAEWAMLGRTE